ncbi:T9SS type A sorting domain-containing protein [candidate division KSB1 bacterium]|nr:T9SS type A sorting domain-containing protein [candidate division KSB1 bacterium]
MNQKKRFSSSLVAISLILCFLSPLFGQNYLGTWYLLKATWNDTLIENVQGTFKFIDSEYYESSFKIDWYNGEAKALYSLSDEMDMFFSQLPQNINTWGGGSSSTNGKVKYDYTLGISQEMWDKVGAVALGWGWPEGAAMAQLPIEFDPDSVMTLSSNDGKTVITYTYGALRPPRNPVIFNISMKIQKQLGNFNPQDGDKVVVRGDFNNWQGNDAELTDATGSGVYAWQKIYPGSKVGEEYNYKYVIIKSAGTEIVESDPARSYIVQPYGQQLDVVNFDRVDRLDEIDYLAITEKDDRERHPATAYNHEDGVFLVAWDDKVNGLDDIYGQLLDADGTAIGAPIPICTAAGPQNHPAVDYNSVENEWMVVWQDGRNENGDIYGMRLKTNGDKLISQGSLNDSSFVICDQDSNQAHPRIAYNNIENTYLVVWHDFRNYQELHEGRWGNIDVYGQRLAYDATLLTPMQMPDSKTNYPISNEKYYDDVTPDVAYFGKNNTEMNEWLVVFSRDEPMYHGGSRIWGVRIKGSNGIPLNTYGEEVMPEENSLARINPDKKRLGGGPPWFPHFVIGFDGIDLWGSSNPFIQGSPHVESNDITPGQSMKKSALGIYEYDVPEFLVAWTDFRHNGDVYCQRIAYFPDSTAFALGLKESRGADSMFTAVAVDEEGDWPEEPRSWMDWPNYPACSNSFYQSWNDLAYNERYGLYTVVWNDWRNAGWTGAWQPPPWSPPPPDIFAQRLWLNPADSSLEWLGHDGLADAPSSLNTPIAFTAAAEGNHYYPAIAHNPTENRFLIAYEYSDSPASIDIYGNIYAGTPPFREGTGVEQKEPRKTPESFTLDQNYPNPFNPTTEISYQLNKPGMVRLTIYNGLGQSVRTLVDRFQQNGQYRIQWNGKNELGNNVPSGLYLCRLQLDKDITVRKMLLIK